MCIRDRHAEAAWAAKGKEVNNYVVHRAIQAMQETGSEWNIMTAVWVLTWKWTAEGSSVHKYSPTASRLAQRLLLSTAAIYLWEVISIDISAAFLQGLPLSEATTREGKRRRVWCRPPTDVWALLREIKELFGLELPPVGFEKHWLFLLLKAAYGLDDAPLLWRKALAEWLMEHGWAESH